MTKLLSSFMSLNVEGGERISYTYINLDQGGNMIESPVKESFYVVDPELKEHIEAIREYIRTNKLTEE